MPKVREVLKHVSVEVAGGKRICHRDNKCDDIKKGVRCLVIKEADMGGHKNYCIGHARPILDQAKADLASLEARLCDTEPGASG